MIRIKFTSDAAWLRLDICGHAGYAESGKDILCSAVSALALNLANSVEALTEDHFTCEVAEESGDFHFYLEHPSREARLLFDSCKLGLELIAKDYGKRYIRIEYHV